MMKPIVIIAIAVVLLIPVSAFGEFTGSAEESITFESKYDWEKDYQYGSIGMGIFIEGNVILNEPFSGQQIVINIQKPNGAMKLHDIIQLDPSGYYGFFLRDASGYWPLGETKIELRNNLAYHVGVITVIEKVPKELDDYIIPKNTEQEIIPNLENEVNSIPDILKSKKYDFLIDYKCPLIEDMTLISDPNDILNQIVVPTDDAVITVNVVHSAFQNIPNNFKIIMYYDDGSIEEKELDDFDFNVNVKNYDGILFKIEILADGYNTLERKINCNTTQNSTLMKNLVAASDIRERDLEESQNFCNYLIEGCEIKYNVDYQINAPNDFIEKSWLEGNILADTDQISYSFNYYNAYSTIFDNDGNKEGYSEPLSKQFKTIVVDKNDLINSESITQEMNFAGFKRTVNYFDLESTIKTIVGYVTINEKYYYDSKTGILLKKEITRSLLDVSGQTNTEKIIQEVSQINFPKNSDSKGGGGCLIATATYGSEMSQQVQQLRELRNNQLMNTESGSAFMGMFNDVYYSFSPVIADYERENPYFKETVKIAITPMISTLSLMENANSESEVLGLGLSVIMLNLGMYLGIPAIVVIGIRKKF